MTKLVPHIQLEGHSIIAHVDSVILYISNSRVGRLEIFDLRTNVYLNISVKPDLEDVYTRDGLIEAIYAYAEKQFYIDSLVLNSIVRMLDILEKTRGGMSRRCLALVEKHHGSR